VHWLAPQYEAVRDRLASEVARLRDGVHQAGQHRRTAAIVAELTVAWEVFLQFAGEAGVLSGDEASRLRQRVRAALSEAAAAQAARHESAEPAELFLRLLATALVTGRCHLAAPTGDRPAEAPEAWGWRRGPGGKHWTPRGPRIGWVQGDDLFLEPAAVTVTVRQMAQAQGESFPLSSRTLRKRLGERGLLAAVDERREVLTIRRTLEGKRRDVLHLRTTALFGDEPAQAPEAGPAGVGDESNGGGFAGGQQGPAGPDDRSTAQSDREAGPGPFQPQRCGEGTAAPARPEAPFPESRRVK
jgi:hypothetical protein